MLSWGVLIETVSQVKVPFPIFRFGLIFMKYSALSYHFALDSEEKIADVCKFEQLNDQFVNLSTDGHFLQQYQHAVHKFVALKFQGLQICLVWIVLHGHKFVNPDFRS